MQLLRHEPAHGSFSRAHEADERNVDDAAVALHWMSLEGNGEKGKKKNEPSATHALDNSQFPLKLAW
jgi:hypothetical protein